MVRGQGDEVWRRSEVVRGSSGQLDEVWRRSEVVRGALGGKWAGSGGCP